MTRLGSLTTGEAGERSGSTLLIPLGSIEQHGPHLPLDTDVVIAEAIAAGVVAAAPDAFVLGPTIAVGAAGEHEGFAGTLSIGNDARASMLVELRRGLGPEFPVLAVVNAHGGNVEALTAARDLSTAEGRELRAWTIHTDGADAHAGRTETSLMLAIAPGAVRVDRMEAGATAPLRELLPELRADGVAGVSPSGVLGDPTGASAEEGAEVLVELIGAARRALDPGMAP